MTDSQSMKSPQDTVRGLQKRFLGMHLGQNRSIASSAAYANVSVETVEEWRKLDPEFNRLMGLYRSRDALSELSRSVPYKNITSYTATSPEEAAALTQEIYGKASPAPPAASARTPAPQDRLTALKEMYYSLGPSLDKDVLHLRQALFLMMLESVGQWNFRETCDALHERRQTMEKVLERIPEDEARQLAEGRYRNWRRLRTFKDPIANIDAYVASEKRGNGFRISIKPLPTVFDGSPEDAAVIGLLSERYNEFGQTDEKSMRMKQALFWSLYEAYGGKNQLLTCELMDIYKIGASNLMKKHIPEAAGTANNTAHMPDNWRALPEYRTYAAIIEKWLQEEGLSDVYAAARRRSTEELAGGRQRRRDTHGGTTRVTER